jgi:hypothetical protein
MWHISVTGIYRHMMRHTDDCGSCGHQTALTLRQLDDVVVLAVVHSLVLIEMEPSSSNLVGRTFKMVLIWLHSGRF